VPGVEAVSEADAERSTLKRATVEEFPVFVVVVTVPLQPDPTTRAKHTGTTGAARRRPNPYMLR